jgi:ADP-heptose:LPS heptosyltransferase
MAREAAGACLTSHEDLSESVALLCDLALSPDPLLARTGADAIFRHVVEPLADAFDPRLADRYIQFFSQVLQRARTVAPNVDRLLLRLGLASEADISLRARRVRQTRRVDGRSLRRIFVLSRVTLGADVAVTSVLLRRLVRAFPAAEIQLVGSAKAALLFGGEPRIGSLPVDYPRGGSLLERLAAWERLVDLLEKETRDLRTGEYLIVDPDSRLTQLGLLPPLGDESAYLFFDSRSYAHCSDGSLAELASAWADEVLGPEPEPALPWVSLPLDLLESARRRAASGHWAAVNLGVGDNPRKRLEGDFEERLIRGLRQAGWNLFLDTGDGGEETQRVEAILSGLGPGPVVAPWRGSIAGFAACIAASCLYVGYDSAGQHLAAALGVPLIDIFAGYSSPRMIHRWRPSGPGPVNMIVVDPERIEPDQVLAQILEAAR